MLDKWLLKLNSGAHQKILAVKLMESLPNELNGTLALFPGIS